MKSDWLQNYEGTPAQTHAHTHIRARRQISPNTHPTSTTRLHTLTSSIAGSIARADTDLRLTSAADLVAAIRHLNRERALNVGIIHSDRVHLSEGDIESAGGVPRGLTK